MQADHAPLDAEFELLASSPRRFSRRVQVVLLVVLVLAGGVLGLRALTHRQPPVRITAYGQPVADPQGVLAEAQRHFVSYATGRHGTLGSDARCWFQRPADSSDVAGTLLCGPVLFYDGDPQAPYLQFALIAHGTASPVHLEALDHPTAADPAAAASGTTLVRPGVTAHPVRTADITAPTPPPAARNVLAMTDAVHPADLLQAPPTAVIGSDTITLTLKSYGPVDAVGTGAAERSAPAWLQLFAFELAFTGGENGFAPLSKLDLGVAIGAAPPRPLHLPATGVDKGGQLFVVATPPTELLFLVFTEDGVTQRLSLRDATPDPGNIEFLQPGHSVDIDPFGISVPAVLTLSGHHPKATHVFVSLDSVVRQFFLPGSGAHPPRNDHIFLFLSIEYRMAELPGTFGFATPDIVTLTPRGGTPIKGRIVNGSATPLFDVPVDMTDATVTLAGDDAHLGYGLSLHDPVTFPLHMVPARR
jgi:hypothetical protein